MPMAQDKGEVQGLRSGAGEEEALAEEETHEKGLHAGRSDQRFPVLQGGPFS